jgi:NAD-dependent DNA ligase
MSHPFRNKRCAFIGVPRSCTRYEAREELLAVGGIISEEITTFLHFVIAFSGAEKTVKYKKALKYAEKGLLLIINEEQFFDVLECREES